MDPDGDVLPGMFGDSWLAVDAFVRLRALIGRLPGYTKNPVLKHFADQTRVLGGARNMFQHLDAKIGSLVAADLPVWGTVTWWIHDETAAAMWGYAAAASSIRTDRKPGGVAGVADALPGVSHLSLLQTAFTRDKADPGKQLAINLSELHALLPPVVATLEHAIAHLGPADTGGSDLVFQISGTYDPTSLGNPKMIASMQIIRHL